MDSIWLAWVQGQRSPELDVVMQAVALLTSGKANTLAAFGMLLFWMARRQWQKAGFLFFGTTLGSAMTDPLKYLFGRVRPLGFVNEGYSFPSGHVLSTTIFYGLSAYLFSKTWPQYRVIGFVAAGFIMALVGFNRVYLAWHWPTDVGAGFIIGLVFVFVWIRIWEKRLGHR